MEDNEEEGSEIEEEICEEGEDDEEFEGFEDIENDGSVPDLELNEEKSGDELGILILLFYLFLK